MSSSNRKSAVTPATALFTVATGRAAAAGDIIAVPQDARPHISLHNVVEAPAEECLTRRFLVVAHADGRIGIVPHPRTLAARPAPKVEEITMVDGLSGQPAIMRNNPRAIRLLMPRV